MKSGAGDDPFADDDPPDDDEPNDDTSTGEPAEQSGPETTNTEDPFGEPTGREPERNLVDEQAGSSRTSVNELPYIARRNVRGESVKTGRDKNVLFELRPEIADREEEFVEELERRLGTDVPKTDAREAALAAIWDRPELVVPVLEEWGLGYFEE